MTARFTVILLFSFILALSACGGDNSSSNPVASLSTTESAATIGQLYSGKVRVAIPADEVGSSLSEDCTVNIAVNNTARHTDLSCDTYFADSRGEVTFIIPNLENADTIEIVITNGDATYTFTFVVSDEFEAVASVSSSSDADSDDGSSDDDSGDFYSPDDDDVDYVTISAIDENGDATVTFPYDVIWDDADTDEEVVVITASCSDDEYHFTYADILGQKDDDGNVSVSFSGCVKDDSVYYYFALSVNVIEDQDVDLSLDDEQQVEIPEVTHTSMSND